MVDLLVVGGLSLDHIVYERAEARFDCLGGPALYAALGALHVPGCRVGVASWIPDDEPRFAEVFAQHEIDVSASVGDKYVERVWILHDRYSRKLVPLKSPSDLELFEPDQSKGRELGLLLSGAEEGTVLLSSPEPGIELPNATVVIDPHQSHVKDLGIEYFTSFTGRRIVFLPSRLQLSLINRDVVTAVKEIHRATGCDIVARLDSDGMWAYGSGINSQQVDADVAVVDTTGAGDSSAGAIAAALSLGDTVEVAMQKALRVVRRTLSDWGASSLVMDDKPKF